MKTFSLPYGNTSLTFTLPESCQIEEILPHPYTMPVNIDQTIQAALKDPLGSTAFSHFPKDASVGIAINDKNPTDTQAESPPAPPPNSRKGRF